MDNDPKTELVNAELFRRKVSEVLAKKEMKVSNLARAANLPPDKLYKFFQGKINTFDIVDAYKIAATLGTSVDDLLSDTSVEAISAKERQVKRTMGLLRQLSAAEQEIVLRQIEGLVGGRDQTD